MSHWKPKAKLTYRFPSGYSLPKARRPELAIGPARMTGVDDGLRVRLHIRQHVLDDLADHPWTVGGRAFRCAYAPGDVGARTGAASDRRSRFRHALPRGTGRRLRRRGLRAVDRDFHLRRVAL